MEGDGINAELSYERLLSPAQSDSLKDRAAGECGPGAIGERVTELTERPLIEDGERLLTDDRSDVVGTER